MWPIRSALFVPAHRRDWVGKAIHISGAAVLDIEKPYPRIQAAGHGGGRITCYGQSAQHKSHGLARTPWWSGQPNAEPSSKRRLSCTSARCSAASTRVMRSARRILLPVGSSWGVGGAGLLGRRGNGLAAAPHLTRIARRDRHLHRVYHSAHCQLPGRHAGHGRLRLCSRHAGSVRRRERRLLLLFFDGQGNFFFSTDTNPANNPDTIYECSAQCQAETDGMHLWRLWFMPISRVASARSPSIPGATCSSQTALTTARIPEK